MDWITGGLLTITALLAATLWTCLRTLRDLRAGRSVVVRPQRFVLLVPGGLPQGPVDRSTLRAMLIDGRLDDLTLAAPIAGDGWRPAAELALDDDDPLTLHPAASLHPPWRR